MRGFLILFFCAFAGVTSASTFSLDSIGSETKDGKTFILHEVGNNETLYSVSRKYDVPIYEIIKYNPPTEYGLDQGQVIRIPLPDRVEKPKQEVVVPQVINATETNLTNTETKEATGKPQVKQEKVFHIVKQSETMFSISRLYEVSIEDLKVWNELVSNNLSIGQELIVKPAAKKEPDQMLSQGNSRQTHEVKQSETLYSISKLYDVTVAKLREWNDLVSNELSIGQLLIVAEEGEVQKATVIIEKPEVKIPTEETVPTVVRIDTAKYNVKPEKRTNFEEVYESGLATEIEGTSGNRKYLALHRSAKAGTIMKVKNEMNDQEVFVRVIGPLPDTSVNKNLVVKISKAAYDRLGAIDPKFRVTVSYIP